MVNRINGAHMTYAISDWPKEKKLNHDHKGQRQKLLARLSAQPLPGAPQPQPFWLRWAADDVLGSSGYVRKARCSRNIDPVELDATTGLDSESRFDGRSGLCVVGLLDVAATVTVAGSPAKESFACRPTRLTDVSDEVLVFCPS